MEYVRLNAKEEQLLREAILKHGPELLPLLDLIGVQPLSAELRERLRDPVATAPVDEGFDEDGTINSLGVDLEDLIDRLWVLSDRT